jgi:predicted nucleic acid-binding protein
VNWLLDTNALSELTKPAPFGAFLDWLEIHEAQTAISAISIGEIISGLEQMPESKRRRSLERNLKFLREDYAGNILDFTEGVSVEWGKLLAVAQKRGRRLSIIDSQIEATAIHFGLMVVTRNEKDFFHPVFNPWK